MAVHSLPQRYATVWGVGHDLEVVEHVIWEPTSVMAFGASDAIDQFREVTAWEYGFPVDPLPKVESNHWYHRNYGTFGIPADTLATQHYGEHAVEQRTKQVAFHQPEIVKDNGFTRIMGYQEMDQWRESLRPELGGRYSVEWIQEQTKAKRKFLGI